MRRDGLAQAIEAVRALVEAGQPVPKDVFEDLLVETHLVCDWYAQDRAELLLLTKALAERAGIPVLRHPLEGRQGSFVVSFALPQGVVGWHVSAGQSDGLGCVEGPALLLTGSTPEHLAFRHERVSAFVG